MASASSREALGCTDIRWAATLADRVTTSESTQLMPRAWVAVDLGALVRNAERLTARAGVPLLPMVKADAYGVGMLPVATALRAVGPWGFGVATIEEGATLRAAGFHERIVVFTPLLADELLAAAHHRLTPTLGDPAAIANWASTRAPWHLTVDTGMQRGVPWDGISAIAALVRAHPPEGAFTHYHSPDRDDGSVAEQDRRFDHALAALPRRPLLTHADNSAAIVRRHGQPHALARPGVFLYGVGSWDDLRPEPVVSVHARIVELHDVGVGESVSYGATWRASRASRIATVGIGYADGYRRAFSNVGLARVRGALAPVVGLVNMDLTLLDVTDLACTTGDIVTFVGDDPSLQLDVVAQRGGLSPYEFLTGLRLRLPRYYR
jgi:alanine racemase